MSEPRRRGGNLPAWLSYGSILLLQLKLVWRIWELRDLPFGDTAGYFARAALWRDGLRVDIVWSPLYTAFYGLFLAASSDAYVATTAHRLAVVLLAALLVLSVARRLLPEPLAWGLAAWWTVLPVHFDTAYEVHLFSVLPVLAAWLVVLSRPGPAGRGWGLGILLACALLVRNEMAVAVLLFAAACVWLERREAREPGATASPEARRRLAAAYAIPLAAAAALALLFHSRSTVKGPDLAAASRPKHTVNMCQAYAFGWQQRHPEWTPSPWTGCSELMSEHFGTPLPTLAEMVRNAPGRVARHVAWNLRLAPAGLQLLLFNVASGPATPDYFAVTLRPVPAWGATALVGLVWAAGLLAARRSGSPVFERSKLSGWLAMAAVAATALAVIPTQRPRPAYLFAAGLFLAALTARFAALLLARAGPRADGWLRLAGLVAMLAAPLAAPRYYAWKARPGVGRPLLTLVRRLAPFGPLVRAPGAVTLVPDFAQEVEGYVGQAYGRPLRVLAVAEACRLQEGEALRDCAERAGATLLHVDDALRERLEAREADRAFLAAPERSGFRRLAPPASSPERWVVLGRIPSS